MERGSYDGRAAVRRLRHPPVSHHPRLSEAVARGRGQAAARGPGGGFPGFCLKVANPKLDIVMIDSAKKKVNFLKHVIRTLNFENIEAHHARAEDFAKKSAAASRFDIITSRALSSIKDFVLMAAPLLAKNGAIIALKGPDLQQEIEGLHLQTDTHTGLLRIGNVQYSIKVEAFTLPHLELQRSIIIFTQAEGF